MNMKMWNPFKKQVIKKDNEPIKWHYGFGIDNIPDNEHLLTYTSINSPDFIVNANNPILHVGDEVIISDNDYPDMVYTCKVTNVCVNFTCHWVLISCDCIELNFKKK